MAIIAVCSKSEWQLAQWASPRLGLAKVLTLQVNENLLA